MFTAVPTLPLAIPVLLWMLAWCWVRSVEIRAPFIKVIGSGLLLLSSSAARHGQRATLEIVE